MPAFLIPLAIAGASALYQGIKGARQKRQAAKLQAEADQQEQSNLADSRRMALTGLPEEQYRNALQGIYRNQSAGLSALRDRRSALAGVPALQQTTNDALLNLNAKDADARRSAERVALGQANRRSGLKGQQAADRLASGQALTGAALNNVFNAASYAAIAGAGADTSGTGGTFGTSSTGLSNRGILGTNPIRGATGSGSAYSGLNNSLPTIPYASAY